MTEEKITRGSAYTIPLSLRIITFAVLALAALLGIYLIQPPAVVPASAPETEFSAERAFAHVQAMDLGPHWVGSPVNAEIRDYIAAELEALGLETEIQAAQVFKSIRRNNPVAYIENRVAYVENVVARLPGTDGGQAILLDTHYDAVRTNRGASYHAYVAALLEIARALTAGDLPKNDIIFLFTDAEEQGFLGAKAFQEQHPWRDEVALVMEIIPRGNSGPVYMFTTSDNNGWLIRHAARAIPYPLMNSFAREVYNLASGTDFDQLGQTYDGFNMGWTDGSTAYHGMADTPANLNQRSLQHLGSYALGLARHFGDLDVSLSASEPNAVYFNTIGWRTVHYPGSWAVPLTVIVALIFAGLVVWGFRRGRLTVGGVGLGFLAILISLAVAQGGSMLLWLVISQVFGLQPVFVTYHGATLDTMAFTLFSIAATMVIISLFRRKVSLFNLAIGSLLWWWISMITTAGLAFPATGNYFLTWSLFFSLIGLIYLMWVEDPPPWQRVLVLLLIALPGLFFMAPINYLQYIGLQYFMPPPGIVPAIIVLTLGLLIPQLDIVTPQPALAGAAGGKPLGAWLLPGSLVLVALGFLTVGIIKERPSPETPDSDWVMYGLHADTGQAYWYHDPAITSDWSSQFLAESPEPGRFQDFIQDFYLHDNFLRSPASLTELPAPQIEVLADTVAGDERTVDLQIVSLRDAETAFIFASSDIPVFSVSVDGRPAPDDQPAGATPETPFQLAETPFQLLVLGLPKGGIRLALEVAAGQPFTLTVADETMGLPAALNFSPRPAHTVPYPSTGEVSADSTWVKTMVAFD